MLFNNHIEKLFLVVSFYFLPYQLFGGVYLVGNAGKMIAPVVMKMPPVSQPENSPIPSLSIAKHMSKKLITLPVDASLAEAMSLLTMNNFRHIPVTRSGKLVGILSDRDVLLAVNSIKVVENYFITDLGSLMTRQVIAVDGDATIGDAAHLMNYYKIDCLPIIQKDGTLQGLLTTTDLLAIIYALDTTSAIKSEFYQSQLNTLLGFVAKE